MKNQKAVPVLVISQDGEMWVGRLIWNNVLKLLKFGRKKKHDVRVMYEDNVYDLDKKGRIRRIK